MGNKRHGTPRTSSHCRTGSKTDACLNCLLHVAAVAVENLVEAQTVSVLNVDKMQGADSRSGSSLVIIARVICPRDLRGTRHVAVCEVSARGGERYLLFIAMV